MNRSPILLVLLLASAAAPAEAETAQFSTASLGSFLPFFGKKENTAQKFEAKKKEQQQSLEWHAVQIPGGAFLMGDHRKDGPLKDAIPEQTVMLDSYLIGETHVTQWEWESVARKTATGGYTYRNWSPASAQNNPESLEDLAKLEKPMANLSWFDALVWCNAKSELHGLNPCYYQKAAGGDLKPLANAKKAPEGVVWATTQNGYRLPTEAEWEKALRGGLGRKPYPWGDLIPEKAPPAKNGFGLSDLVSESGAWCWDRFSAYSVELKTNPIGPVKEGGIQDRMLRGRSTKQGPLPFVFQRERINPGNPAGGLRLAATLDSPFLVIPEGEFKMGDSYTEKTAATEEDYEKRPANVPKPIEYEGATEEYPVHTVKVPEFQLSRTDVSFREWKTVKVWAEKNGYDFTNPGSAIRDDHPVTQINWYDALKWCNARSEKEGLAPFYYTSASRNPGAVYRRGQVKIGDKMLNWDAAGYRLPTEAEWERAAKLNNPRHRYPCGKQISHRQAVFTEEVENVATRQIFSVGHPVFQDGTAPVRTFYNNGLYNMAGNVWQWCWDSFKPYPDSSEDSPAAQEAPEMRVIRGGSWKGRAWDCRSSRRGRIAPEDIDDAVGFRVARK
jgi:formylglycine-generating enzyme required for sulfatase activity